MADEKKRDDDYAVEMGERRTPNGHFNAEPKPAPPSAQAMSNMTSITNNPAISIMAYCGSSILMMVANKYVVKGTNFNLNFFLLAVQVSL